MTLFLLHHYLGVNLTSIFLGYIQKPRTTIYAKNVSCYSFTEFVDYALKDIYTLSKPHKMRSPLTWSDYRRGWISQRNWVVA